MFFFSRRLLTPLGHASEEGLSCSGCAARNFVVDRLEDSVIRSIGGASCQPDHERHTCAELNEITRSRGGWQNGKASAFLVDRHAHENVEGSGNGSFLGSERCQRVGKIAVTTAMDRQ